MGLSNYHLLMSIAGARAYYMRNIMLDWPDEKCIQDSSKHQISYDQTVDDIDR